MENEARAYELHIGDVIYLSYKERYPILNENLDGLKCIEVVDYWTDGYIKQLFKWIKNEWMLHFSKYKENLSHKSLKLIKKTNIFGGKYEYIGMDIGKCIICGETKNYNNSFRIYENNEWNEIGIVCNDCQKLYKRNPNALIFKLGKRITELENKKGETK